MSKALKNAFPAIALLLSLMLVLATGCSSHRLNDDRFLENCWGASRVAGQPEEYRLRIDAIVIPAVAEGGTFARNRTCRDYRIRVHYENPAIKNRFDRIADAALYEPALGTGIHADVQVRVKERNADYLMTVVVTRLYSMRTMDRSETRRFLADFNIG